MELGWRKCRKERGQRGRCEKRCNRARGGRRIGDVKSSEQREACQTRWSSFIYSAGQFERIKTFGVPQLGYGFPISGGPSFPLLFLNCAPPGGNKHGRQAAVRGVRQLRAVVGYPRQTYRLQCCWWGGKSEVNIQMARALIRYAGWSRSFGLAARMLGSPMLFSRPSLPSSHPFPSWRNNYLPPPSPTTTTRQLTHPKSVVLLMPHSHHVMYH